MGGGRILTISRVVGGISRGDLELVFISVLKARLPL